MKSLSTISAIVILATAMTACSKHKSSIRENADGSIKTETESVVATKADFVDSLTADSWVSGCDKNQKRVRLEFEKTTKRMITYDESCSRGEKNSELEGTPSLYELTSFDAEDNSMFLQIYEIVTPVAGVRPSTNKGDAVQAFKVLVDGDKLSFVGLLPEGVEFPMHYSRLPVTKSEALLY